MDSINPITAVRNITELMNSYRECSRNLWNVYFSKQKDIGFSLDIFGQIRELLFELLVLNEVSTDREGENGRPPTLTVVPRLNSPALIQRLSAPGEAGYWDQEPGLVVGPDDVTLVFLDLFDFSEVPLKEFRYYRCKVLRFPRHGQYEGREALLEVIDCDVFLDQDGESLRLK